MIYMYYYVVGFELVLLESWTVFRAEILEECGVDRPTKLIAYQMIKQFKYDGKLRLHRLLILGSTCELN